MIWRLMNLLFGWDYIAWSNSADQGIARVYADHSGKVFYWRYRITGVVDVILEPNDYIWLTCLPSKYFMQRRIPFPEFKND